MESDKASKRRCAIYTRKSSEEGLEQDFNSLQAQREACESYIKSQQGEGWRLVKTAYDDGGLSGATMNRPSLQHLLSDSRKSYRCGGCLQSRSPHALPRRLRQDGRDFRCS
jgi:DNA invertase Pin-like site-specific DNA recombinase